LGARKSTSLNLNLVDGSLETPYTTSYSS